LLKKTITYTNPFTDEEVTEDHYFHISKADLVEMEMEEHKAEYTSKNGEKLTGLQAKLQKIVDSEDGKAIIAEFKDIIRRAYGKKDGDRFLKSKEIWEEFSSTEAYSQLIFEVCTDAKVSGEFINGIIPNNLEQIAKEIREQAGKESSAIAAVEKVAHDTGTEFPGDEAVSPKASMAVEPSEEDPTGLTRHETPRILTNAEVAEMDAAELKSGLAVGRYKLA
jgi:hypothetical protein